MRQFGVLHVGPPWIRYPLCSYNLCAACTHWAIKDNVALTSTHKPFDSWITRGARSENFPQVYEFPEIQARGAQVWPHISKSPSLPASQASLVTCNLTLFTLVPTYFSLPPYSCLFLSLLLLLHNHQAMSSSCPNLINPNADLAGIGVSLRVFWPRNTLVLTTDHPRPA